MDYRFKAKVQHTKTLEKNPRKSLLDIGMGKEFMMKTLKVQTTKTKTSKN